MVDLDLGLVALPSDAALALQRLAADSAAVNASVQGCPSLDAATHAEWAAYYSYLKTFTAQTPVWFFPTAPTDVLTTGYLSEDIIQNQRQLLAWQQRLSTKCTAPPVEDPGALSSTAKLLGQTLGGTASLVPWIAGAVAVVAAAYLGGKVITLLPTAKMRARTNRERERTARYALKRG